MKRKKEIKQWKKFYYQSVAALAVFAAAAPVFAQGENPNASNQLIQKKYVSWRDAADEANTQVAAHEAEINAEAENDPAVVAAKQALEAYGSGHEYETYVAKLEAARAEARNTVRNRYIQVFQQNYINAAKAQGNYYDETAVEANRTNEQRIADDIKAQTGKDVTVTTDEKGNVVVKDEKGNVIGTVDKNGKLVKADAKAGKALPKTSAVK